MSIFRIYPNKTNTAASGTNYELLNSSQNPVTDLWYGGTGVRQSISRHLMYFDLMTLQSKLNTKEINESLISAYKLKLKNVIANERVLEPEGEFNVLDKKVAASYNLIAFPINKFWDEGRGFDMEQQREIIKSSGSYEILSGYSNWISATSTVDWDEPGIFSDPTGSTAVTNYVSQNFSIGDEDIEMDITSIVNDWLSGGSENYGIAIAYNRNFELETGNTRYIASFYTNKTNTAYKPFIEVQYNQAIKDDRFTVANDRVSRLFLYTFSGGVATNYSSASTVSIQTSAGSDIYTGLTPTQLSKGVYYVDVWMSGTTKGQRYKDVWKGVSFNPPYDSQDFTQSFTIQGSYYSDSNNELNDYSLNVYGIENNGIIQPSEIRRVYAEARQNYSLKKPKVDYGLEYRMTLNQVDEIIPWTQANSAIINGCQKSYFDIDASWLLDNQIYEITFRISELGTKRMMDERIIFKVREGFSKVNL